MIVIERDSFIQLSKASAAHLSLQMTKEQLLISLPDGKLNASHIEQGLANINISASRQKNNIKLLILPALVVDKDGALLLIINKQQNNDKTTNYTILGLTENNVSLQLSQSELTTREIQACWLIANKKLIQR